MRRLQQTLVLILGFAGCVAPIGAYSAENQFSIKIVNEIQGTTLLVSPSDLSTHLIRGDKISIFAWNSPPSDAIFKSIETVEATTTGDGSEAARQVLVVRLTNSHQERHYIPAEIVLITIHDPRQVSGPEISSAGNTSGSETSRSDNGDSESAAEQFKPYKSSPTGVKVSFCENVNKRLEHPAMITTHVTTVYGATTTCLPTSTTNAVIISSSGLPDNAAYDRLQRYRFVAQTHNRLAADFSAGGGEHADALISLFGCPPERRVQYINLVRQDFDQIFTANETDPANILARLEAGITQHPDLSIECTRVS